MAFVGKLIVNKGVDLLIAAWPLVLEQVPRARLEIVGFGGDAEWLELLLETLAAGDLERAIDVARAGRARGMAEPHVSSARGAANAQAGTHARPTPLRHLAAFLGALRGQRRERYLAAARTLPERARFAGRMEHEGLAELLPACEALVVPSTFPEAFGMVAAEGAACGALPVSAGHSGLAEVSGCWRTPSRRRPRAGCRFPSTTMPCPRSRGVWSAGCGPIPRCANGLARGWLRQCVTTGRGRVLRGE